MTLKYTKLSCGIIATPRFNTKHQQLAVVRSQSEVLRVLTEEGLAVADARDGNTFATALLLAAGRGHTSNVRCLLRRVEELVLTREIQWEALHCTWLQWLDDWKLDKNLWTPLMVATREGYSGIVERLVDCHSSLEVQNTKGDTALSVAVQCGHLAISRFLLGVGANVDTKDIEGMTPLMIASRNGQLRLVELLIARGADLELCCNSGHSALHFAAGNGRLEVVRELVSAGANLHARDQIRGLTPLMYAAMYGHADIVKDLLPLSCQRDVDTIETKCNKKCTALYLAASQRRKTVCELLLDVGRAAVDARDWKGYTPLMVAAKRGYVEIVQVLLSRGANIEAVNDDGNRALEIASRNGRTAVVQLLLENGAFVDAPNRTRGYTALTTAALRGRTEVQISTPKVALGTPHYFLQRLKGDSKWYVYCLKMAQYHTPRMSWEKHHYHGLLLEATWKLRQCCELLVEIEVEVLLPSRKFDRLPDQATISEAVNSFDQ
ncbi:Ankyrin repeat domain containing hypothetical protein 52 [Phytophthora palmivora]|uniref:Uncharacterized protein n=1 Tax=Phytophthora palmivora TaxID=4796 RepID=A0A2P4YM66_9STRA|nr:Ankyrin repeat domain containing hypothetical protein 52 [Phytophthora palmivora]